MLVHESTPTSVPPLLSSLVRNAHIDDNDEQQVAALTKHVVIACHVLLLEAGFETVPSGSGSGGGSSTSDGQSSGGGSVAPIGAQNSGVNLFRLANSEHPTMPDGWLRPSGVFRLTYVVYPPQQQQPMQTDDNAAAADATLPPLQCYVTFVPLATFVNIRALFGEQHYELKINASDFVAGEASASDSRFKNLRHLSKLFKDGVALPLLYDMLRSTGVDISLTSLPVEILLRLMRCVDVTTLLRLACTCQLMNSIQLNNALWQHRFKCDFPAEKKPSTTSATGASSSSVASSHPQNSNSAVTTSTASTSSSGASTSATSTAAAASPEDVDWKQRYKDEYVKRTAKRRNELRQASDDDFDDWRPLLPRLPFAPESVLPPFGPAPGPWPPIIGGEHDIFPFLPPRPRRGGGVGGNPPMLPRPPFGPFGNPRPNPFRPRPGDPFSGWW